VVVRHAQALEPLADRFDELTQTYLAEWRDIQSAIEYLVQQLESSQEARDAALGIGFPNSVLAFAASVVEGAETQRSLATTLEETGSASKVLRRATARMAQAARRRSEPVPVVIDWQQRIGKLFN
jgi:hypothetical protein